MSLTLTTDFPGVPAGEVFELDQDGNWRGTTHPEFWMSPTAAEQSEHLVDSEVLAEAAKAVTTFDGEKLVVTVEGRAASDEVAAIVIKQAAEKVKKQVEDVKAAEAVADAAAVVIP